MAGSYPAPAAGRRPGFFRALWRALRQIFHETTGALFFILAVSWTAATIRFWRHGAHQWVLGVCGGVVLLFVAFGFTSFRSARRVR